MRHILRVYLALAAVDALRKDLTEDGIVNKVYRREDGRLVGGKPLHRGALYRMLQNLIYRGQIRHWAQVHPGQHPAIIGEDLWQAVQARLEANRIADANKTNARAPSLLAGRIRTDAGDPFMPSHANKNGKRYRYYVSRPAEGVHQKHRRWCLPAGEVEGGWRSVPSSTC